MPIIAVDPLWFFICLRRRKTESRLRFRPTLQWLFMLPCLTLAFQSPAMAQTVCARVKLEIQQDLVMERQAFDARMRITNELLNIPLEDVAITVNFEDDAGNPILASSDPSNTAAKFFIRLDSMDGVDDVAGDGVIPTGSTADVHWLIIPAPGAAGLLSTGTFYAVGATLTYSFGGETDEMEIALDFINVRPLPNLSLDYFVTRDIFADDAFTDAIEPPVPFSLGVRVRNTGSGEAARLQIDSAQPEIVDYEQGLLIGFSIEGSTVNDEAAAPTLLVDFGNLPGYATTTARWIMYTTLSGQFVEFGARYSHDDALGGELTSLLESVTTHDLIRDVRVDLAGRNVVKDFLALDGDVLRVYESSGLDTEVVDQSNLSTLTEIGSGNGFEVANFDGPATAGFHYAKIPDLYAGRKLITRALRSDGKALPLDNVWFSKTRNGTSWSYWMNLFDVNSTGQYTLSFDTDTQSPQAPALQFVPDRDVIEINQVSFIVEASDPNGDPVLLTAAPLPAGATFIDQRGGLAIFDWTPEPGQAGDYLITFTASDGALSTTRSATITVLSTFNTDADSLPDAWEIEYFCTLDRDGSGDFDKDGISDAQEYLDGTDPTLGTGPSQPQIASPYYGETIANEQPSFGVFNSVGRTGVELTYTFEVYGDTEMRSLISRAADLAQGGAITSWKLDVPLAEDTTYHWRARSFDGSLYSLWSHGRYFVNQIDDPPNPVRLLSPTIDTSVHTRAPILTASTASDADSKRLSYYFSIASDASMQNVIASSGELNAIAGSLSGALDWQVSTELTDNTYYYWKVVATDDTALTNDSEIGRFFTDTGASALQSPGIVSPALDAEIISPYIDIIVANSANQDGTGVVYQFEIESLNSFDSPARQLSGWIAEGTESTRFAVNSLEDNTTYYWRVRSSNGVTDCPWITSRFTVIAHNEAPPLPVVNNPGDGAWSASISPTLSVRPSLDPEGEAIQYRIELYSDEALSVLETETLTVDTHWLIWLPLANNTWHYWRFRAEDVSGNASVWSTTQRFFIEEDADDQSPLITSLSVDSSRMSETQTVSIRWNDIDLDSNAGVALYYDIDASGANGESIVQDIAEDIDGDGDQYHWNVSNLPAGEYWVYAVIDDGRNSATVYAANAIVIAERLPPQFSGIQISPNPVRLSMPLNVTATASDIGLGDSTVVSAEYSVGGGPYRSMQASDGQFDTTYEAIEANIDGVDPVGVYYLCLRATDAAGNITSPICQTLAVHEPGKGTIKQSSGTVYSPAGADSLDPLVSGEATFSLDAKYKVNSSVPSGKLNFSFQPGSIDFQSTSIEWLITADPPRARLGGFGQLNGSTLCRFEVDAYDKTLTNQDGFGIRIYDCGVSGLRYMLNPTVLLGGKLRITP